MYVVTDDLQLTAARCLTVRLQDLTPRYRAYLTLLEVRGRVRNHRQGQRQAFVVPFPHAIPEAKAEHLRLAGVQDSTEAAAIFNAFARVFPPPPIPAADAGGAGSSAAADLPPGAQAHGVGLNLYPSFDALRHGADWTPYIKAGDFERTFTALAEAEKKHGRRGYALLDTTVSRTTPDVGGMAGWVWFGEAAAFPAGFNRAPALPLQAWVVNDFGTRLCSATPHFAAAPSPVLPASATDILRTLLESVFVGPTDLSRSPTRLEVPPVRHALSVSGTTEPLLSDEVLGGLATVADPKSTPPVDDPLPVDDPPPEKVVVVAAPPAAANANLMGRWLSWLGLAMLFVAASVWLALQQRRRQRQQLLT